jgi:phosphoribosyl-AMP cyclohydrolase
MRLVRFDRNGLVPAVVQDLKTGRVLLLAFMNRQALALTASTGLAHFFSRSRGKLWKKGEESGHVLQVTEIRVGCEGNSLLLRVRMPGPGACHTGHESCFFRAVRKGRLVVTDRARFDPAEVYRR